MRNGEPVAVRRKEPTRIFVADLDMRARICIYNIAEPSRAEPSRAEPSRFRSSAPYPYGLKSPSGERAHPPIGIIRPRDVLSCCPETL